jgi:hypothetical protein
MTMRKPPQSLLRATNTPNRCPRRPLHTLPNHKATASREMEKQFLCMPLEQRVDLEVALPCRLQESAAD